MLKELIAAKNLAPFLSRAEMLDIIQKEEYGYLPKKPEEIRFETVISDKKFCASKATFKKIIAHCTVRGRSFSFPFYSVIPNGNGKYPVFLHINFRDSVPDKYMPSEEIVDNGFACLSFCYEDVTSDDNDMSNGLAGILFQGEERNDDDPGKIAMWAWASHRVMDYIQTQSNLTGDKSVVCGHSRLGKTALLAAATDTRFTIAYSNDSGCSGAALYNKGVGETVEAITDRFPQWFCKNYSKYRGMDGKMPFDQHYLTACIFPRKVYIASAEEDTWADPESEFLNCIAISELYRSVGMKGLSHSDKLPTPPELFHGGDVAYHIRKGTHYFSREDWLYLMQYAKQEFAL